MAEAIALGASVIAVLQVADRVIGLCKFYIETVGEAAAELNAILLEASILKTIFENLKFLTACNKGTCTLMSALSGEDGPIEGCRRSIAELERLFPNHTMQQGGRQPSGKQKLSNTWNALAWPLKKRRAKKLLDEISQYKTTIMLALTTVQSQDITTIKTKTVEMHEIITDSQLQDVYRWLQHTDPSPLHNRAVKQYESGTGNWMARLPEWRGWLNAENRCLWLYGIPGAGKTVLMAHLIENIKAHCQNLQGKKAVSAYYYAYFGHNQDEAEPFLRWIIEQICRQDCRLPKRVYQMYKAGGTPSLSALLSAVEDLLEDLDLVYISLDAVDESSPREDLLKVLRDLANDTRFQKIQLLVSSRSYIDIEQTMSAISKSVSMKNTFVEDDIRLHVRSTLSSNAKFLRWSRELRIEVEDALAKGAQGMFRWAVCQLHVLQRVRSDKKIIYDTLKSLPKTLDETYDRIFLEISEEDALIVQKALHWMHYYSKLHGGDSIPCAILLSGIERSIARGGTTLLTHLDMERLRELCGCLVNISLPNSMHHDELYSYQSTASFAHYTVVEYLTSTRTWNRPTAQFSLFEDGMKPEMIETVLSEAMEGVLDITKLGDNKSISIEEALSEELEENFRSYCTFCCFICLKKSAYQISQNRLLSTLAIALVDPSKPHYTRICSAAALLDKTDVFGGTGMPIGAAFWTTNHDDDKFDYETWHLYNLLCLSGWSLHLIELARKLMEVKDLEVLLRVRMALYKEAFSPIPYEESEFYRFDGTLIEVFSQLALDQFEAFKLLLERGEGLFNASEILVLFIGFHRHDIERQCKGYCPLARLLKLKADPNASGYKVSPLQIAVAARDFESVRLLLEAGANPNGMGDSSGKRWEKNTLMRSFNRFHVASPLYICRNLEGAYSYNDEYMYDTTKDLENIEAVLLEYGANEFVRSPGDPSEDMGVA